MRRVTPDAGFGLRMVWRVLIAYADESGDSGPIGSRGSLTYTVGCVLVDAEAWAETFDGLIAFRRQLARDFGIPVRAEVKATYLVSGSGSLRKLGLTPGQRQLIFRQHLRLLSGLNMRAFAVVIDKRPERIREAPDALAWQTLIERLERTTRADKAPFLLMHDNGNNDLVRKVARKARRRITAGSAFGGGQITLAATRFLDDPSPRDSAQSYMVQCADLVAYAAFRAVIEPGRQVRQVAPPDLWADIGTAIHRPVNSISGGTPGIVHRTK